MQETKQMTEALPGATGAVSGEVESWFAIGKSVSTPRLPLDTAPGEASDDVRSGPNGQALVQRK